MKYIITFKVKATYAYSGFPIDMLRYERAFPASEEDSARIEACFHPRREAQEVTLKMFSDTKDRNLSFERWESFGWKVVAHSVKADRA